MKNSGVYIGPLILIVIGLLFLFDNLNLIDSWTVIFKYWPILLIILGIHLLTRKSYASSQWTGQKSTEGAAPADFTSDEEVITRSDVFGDVRTKISANQFKGGVCSTVFGDIDLDLTDCRLADGAHRLKVSAVAGDVTIRVPASMPISASASIVAGDIQLGENRSSGVVRSLVFTTADYHSADRKLFIQISLTFGDITVRRY